MSLDRQSLVPIVIEALKGGGGSARMRDIARFIWENHERELRASGEFFFVWQYDLRWAGDTLVRQKKIKKGPPNGTWHLI
jgi:hypothetical protein